MLIFILSLSKNCFANESKNVMPFFPGGTQEDPRIKTMAQSVKKFPYYGKIAIYLAVRADNPTLCQSYGCNNNELKNIMYFRYAGEGRCDDIKVKPGENAEMLKMFCEGIKNGNCNASVGSNDQKNACNAFVNEDIDKTTKLFIQLNGMEKDYNSVKDKILLQLGIVEGYKKYSVIASERFTNQINANSKVVPLIEQLSYKILFVDDPDAEAESILKDIALFDLAKKEGSSDYCEKISHGKIKEACHDAKFKNQDSLFGL